MFCPKCGEKVIENKILYKVTMRECTGGWEWCMKPETLHTGYDKDEARRIYHESAGKDYAQKLGGSYRMTRLEYIDESENVIKMVENSELRTIVFPNGKGILL